MATSFEWKDVGGMGAQFALAMTDEIALAVHVPYSFLPPGTPFSYCVFDRATGHVRPDFKSGETDTFEEAKRLALASFAAGPRVATYQ